MKVLPRNTLVTVAPIKEAAKKVGSIVLPARQNSMYQQAEVVQVGPGMVDTTAGLSLTRDLKPGQRVLVKLNNQIRISMEMTGLEPIGVEFKDDSGRELVLVEQTQIVAILEGDDLVTV